MAGSAIDPSKILKASSLYHSLKALGQRCGYKENISAYAFRRGFANGIDGKVSAPKLRQLMGHSNDGVLQSYLSSTIGIDTQNAVRGLPQDTDRVNFSRSVGFSRDIGAPMPHQARLGNPALPEGKITEMSLIFSRMSRAQIKSRIYEEERKQYFDTPCADVCQKYVPTDQQRLQPVSSSLFNLVLKFDLSRESAIHALWSTGEHVTSLEEIVRPLVQIANPTPFQPWYPHIPQPNTFTDDPDTCSTCFGQLPSMKLGTYHGDRHVLWGAHMAWVANPSRSLPLLYLGPFRRGSVASVGGHFIAK
ncbi:hypothetical protein GQ43DRAFT_475037 [Delitschia confertaspora ATCC 74209]|uniref:Uncharacterized protein n=1 Tax=Delitschia confertaspora ATCC 74209 TaxID=1513339 RepID=A0A9P4JED6_9PLEO|nr:hypothetical protein GQ43DRAFT_475037 [Delitschia confertaspora ATCC 74209]